jgi:hypothetical protein
LQKIGKKRENRKRKLKNKKNKEDQGKRFGPATI